jgi:hypothetical protein
MPMQVASWLRIARNDDALEFAPSCGNRFPALLVNTAEAVVNAE